jgi:putative ABC transport system ATP-binding protein
MQKGAKARADIVRVDKVHLRLDSRAGAVDILRGVNLRLKAGESLGLVGPSGSGKSTLLMAMAGLERITSGAINVAGRDITNLSEDELAHFRRDHMGIVFQSFHLVPTMTAVENVALPLELAYHKDALEQARGMLAAVGLDHRQQHYPAQLSGGEQQRVALARALVGKPNLLLADEPTGNLDQKTGEQIMDLLFTLSEQFGTTLFLITHDASLASRCDRVLHMRDGKLVRTKT